MKKLFTKILVAACAVTILTGCGKKKEVEPQVPVDISFDNASSDSVKKAMNGKEPDNIEKTKESGIEDQQYNDYKYAGYKGTMHFYYMDSKLSYYHWNITEKDSKKAHTVYEDVAATLAATYGDGEENNNAASEFYTTTYNDNTVVVQQIKNGDTFDISFKVTE